MKMEEVNPLETTRAYAYRMWMKAPMPMVTLTTTLDVTRLRSISRRRGLKFNMLMCWCIGKAATQVPEFSILPVGDRLIRYDSIAVSTVVADRSGGVSSCDIPWTEDLARFDADYLRLTRLVAERCENHDLNESMVIGTSALTQCEIDGAAGMYSGIFNNPFLIWGRYGRRFLRTTLKISFQFHHTQMDGAHAARFLSLLQKAVNAPGLK